MRPYLLVSDSHAHAWAAFSKILPSGVNSRLQIILDAHREAVAKLRGVAGPGVDRMFHGGDVFHTRSRVDTEVLNPTIDCYRELADSGLRICMVAGNHDCSKNDSERIGNAVTALEGVGVNVAHEPTLVELASDWAVVQFSWIASKEELLAQMKTWQQELDGRYRVLDAHIHTAVNGVLAHLPDHGFSPDELADIGFTRVFAGHFHCHRDLGRGVYSIGALTHQTFGDIGSKAGYCLVYPDRVEHYETAAPKFVELTGDETEEEADAKMKGNYVRVRFSGVSDDEAEELRAAIFAKGAAGVSMQVVPNITVTRSATATSGGASIERSIGEFITKKGYANGVQALCEDILTEARVGE